MEIKKIKSFQKEDFIRLKEKLSVSFAFPALCALCGKMVSRSSLIGTETAEGVKPKLRRERKGYSIGNQEK